jgi:branched-chain amino acid transport system substrate-binding protein
MRNYLKWLVVLTLIAALLAMGGIACNGEEEETQTPEPTATAEPTEAPKEAFKIGAVFATTGGASSLGVPEKNTVEMMEEQINAMGGINGHEIDVIFYDTGTEEKHVTMVTRLIEQDEVLAIVGPTTSGESMGVIDTVTTAEVPLVSCAAALSIVTPVEERYWVFKTPQTEVEAVNEIYAYAQAKGITKVGIITNTNVFGQAGKTYLESDAADYGITIVDNQVFNPDDVDMTAQLTSIAGTDAEAVICWSTDKESAVVADNMLTLQMDIPLFCSHGVANPNFIAQAGEAANGVKFPAGKLLIIDQVPEDDPQKDILVQYKNAYESMYGEGTINTFGGHAFDALSLVLIALENVEDDMTLAEARSAVRDGLESAEFAGTGGVFNMSAEDHLGMAPGSLAMIEVVDGEWARAE